jgi:hypothetical protein
MRVRAVEERVDAAKQTIAEVRAKWRGKLELFKGEKRAKLDELHARQKRECGEFERHWGDRATLLAFSKPSPQLLLVRKQHRQAVLAEDFTRAMEIKRHVDELERAETVDAERRAITAMNLAQRNLRRKHRQEEEHTVMNWSRQVNDMEVERDAEVEKVQMHLRQLEITRKRVRNSKARVIPAVSRPPTPAPTPRVRRRVCEAETLTQKDKLRLMGFTEEEQMTGKRKWEFRRRRISCRRPEFQNPAVTDRNARCE